MATKVTCANGCGALTTPNKNGESRMCMDCKYPNRIKTTIYRECLCGSTFPVTRKKRDQQYCSKPCVGKYTSKARRTTSNKVECSGGCGALVVTNATSAESPKCRDCRYPKRTQYPIVMCPCGVEFQSGHDRKEYCSKLCARLYCPKMAAWRAQFGVWAWRSILQWGECRRCKVPILTRNGRTYCSAECRAEPKSMRVFFPQCTDCHLTFSCRNGQSRRCRPCKERLWRRNGRVMQSKASKKVNRIGDRDRWTCGICQTRVSKRTYDGSPRSKTVDHIVPRSEGIALGWSRAQIDDDSNLRLAHLTCNVMRSNAGGGEQLALVG